MQPLNRIPCFSVAWLDYEAIFQHIQRVSALSEIQLIMIENMSRYTQGIIKPYILDRMRDSNLIHRYYLFEKNIGKDALGIVLNLHLDLIAASPFVLITDADVVPLDNEWLAEEIAIMTNYKNCGSCRIQFDFSDIPLATVPDSAEWQKRCGGIEHEDHFETHMGGYLVLMRGPLLADILKELRKKKMEVLDITIHRLLLARRKKMLTTKKSRFKHYSWVRLQELTHPSCQLKMSSSREKIWHIKRTCSFWEYHDPLSHPIFHQMPTMGGSVFNNEYGE